MIYMVVGSRLAVLIRKVAPPGRPGFGSSASSYRRSSPPIVHNPKNDKRPSKGSFAFLNHLQVFATTMGGNSLFKGVTVSCSRGNKPNRIISSELREKGSQHLLVVIQADFKGFLHCISICVCLSGKGMPKFFYNCF